MLLREKLLDLEDELTQFEGTLPTVKNIALTEQVVDITPEVIDNRSDLDNIIGSGLSLDEQLQLAHSAKK